MKVAKKVIFLLDGGDGLCSVIYGGLHPNPSSNFQTRTDFFDLSLERYGIEDRRASGEILHHVNANGFLELSILLLQNYEPPVLACAMNEVLLNLAGDDSSTLPTIIALSTVSESNLQQEKYLVDSGEGFYGVKLGPTTELTDAFSSKVQKPPPSLQIYSEGVALLLHLVNVMKFPAFVLVARSKQPISDKSSKEELEVIYDAGEHIANVMTLSFSRETIMLNPIKMSRDSEEAWRMLYG